MRSLLGFLALLFAGALAMQDTARYAKIVKDIGLKLD